MTWKTGSGYIVISNRERPHWEKFYPLVIDLFSLNMTSGMRSSFNFVSAASVALVLHFRLSAAGLKVKCLLTRRHSNNSQPSGCYMKVFTVNLNFSSDVNIRPARCSRTSFRCMMFFYNAKRIKSWELLCDLICRRRCHKVSLRSLGDCRERAAPTKRVP